MCRNYIIFLFAILFLNACGNKKEVLYNFEGQFEKEKGGMLTDAMSGEPSNLISMIAGDSASSAISGNIFNKLIKYDKNLDLASEIAEKWIISNDQKTITFFLKKNLKWEDGYDLSSEDVLFTWKLITDDKTRTPYGSDYKLVEKAEAPDLYTFKVTYKKAYAPALDTWASLQILPKHILKDEDINNTFFSRKPIGSSYYKLSRWMNGEKLTLEASTSSVMGLPNINKLTSRFIPDTSSQFLELIADNIDLMNINPIQYARVIPSRPDLEKKLALYKELGNSYTYLGFNLNHTPFNDIKIRQAINYAIDKQEVIDGVLLGLGEPVASPYKPGTRWSNKELHPYPYNKDRAIQLLNEAGFIDTNHDGILEKNGKSFTFEILTNQNKQREMTAVLIQRRLKDVGIDVKIRVIEWASFVNQYIKTGDFDAVILGWSLSLDPDQYNIWHSSQQKPGQFNFIGYTNKEVDNLLEQGRTELNIDKREKIYHTFSKILLDESPVIYLYAGYGLMAISKRIKGIDSPAPPAGIAYNSYDWFIPSTLRRNEITE
ncbi:MAG: peptide-binding protein [Candidatus Methylopumilus sp.]|nr:peptide-binding protein [Candidatus Methylopumilus sp.]